jgi:hypothetical protein
MLPKMLSLLLPLLLGLNQGLDVALRLESCMELEANVDYLVSQARDLHFSMARYGWGILEAHAHRRVADKHGFEETAAPANEVPMLEPRWKYQLHSTACSQSGSAKHVCGRVDRTLLNLDNCAVPLAGHVRDTSHCRVHRFCFAQLAATRGAEPLLELGLDGCWAAMVLLGAIPGALLENPRGDASACFLVVARRHSAEGRGRAGLDAPRSDHCVDGWGGGCRVEVGWDGV